MKKITIVQGHPDPQTKHFGHALADTYAEAARAAAHDVRTITVAALEFPLLRTKNDFEKGVVPPALRQAAEDIQWADHLVILFPLWLGTMPAILKAFLEQVLRPEGGTQDSLNKLLKGKTGRVVVTMGMPAALYRWYFRAHGVRGLEKSVLRFCGMRSIKENLIGLVESPNPRSREKWLAKMREFGTNGD